MPPESPKPRESHVSTLKPALRSGPTPTLPVCSLEPAFGLVSRLPPQPWVWRIVGARPPGARPSARCRVTISGVPSKDGTMASRATAGAAPASMAPTVAASAAIPRTAAFISRNIPRGPGFQTALVQARQRGGHPVLPDVRPRDADAVHEEGEGDAAAAPALAVTGERGDPVERAGLGAAAVPGGGLAHPFVERPGAAGDGEGALEGLREVRAVHADQQVDHVARRRAVAAREARAVDDPRAGAELLHGGADHRRARRGAAAQAELGADGLDERLRVEVVR